MDIEKKCLPEEIRLGERFGKPNLDNPPCYDCGTILVDRGASYICPNCFDLDGKMDEGLAIQQKTVVPLNGPPCDRCGTIMMPEGAGNRCHNCNATDGCT